MTGLEIGADDYLAKPFETRELILRLSNILRRASRIQPTAAPASPRGDPLRAFVYRFDRGELRRDEDIIRITDREREILNILGHSAGGGRREDLAGGNGANERTVDVQINRLRRKIEVDPANPVFLQTVRGVGYRLLVEQ